MITAQELVSREVYYCVSYLIQELAKDSKHSDELWDVLLQTDYESPARNVGWDEDDHEISRRVDGSVEFADDWQDACESSNLAPYEREAYEHWIVSDWLARKLEAKSEMVIFDFLGLTIWGRTTTGQTIYMDGVIEEICKELNR